MSNFLIKKENFSKGYDLLVAVNKHDEYKTLGISVTTIDSQTGATTVETEPMAINGVPYDYDQQFSTLLEVLNMVGIRYKLDFFGNIVKVGFVASDDESTPELFLSHLAPVVEDGSSVSVIAYSMDYEDDQPHSRTYSFSNGKMSIYG